MATCDDYQLSLEMHRHGATPRLPVPELEAHVASCPTCAAYGASAAEVDIMSTTHWLHNEPVGASRTRDEITAHVARERRDFRLMVATTPLVLLAYAAFNVVRDRPWHDDAWVLLPAMAIVSYLRWRRLAALQRSVADATARGDLMELMRTRLDAELRRSRFGVVALPAAAIGFTLMNVADGRTGLAVLLPLVLLPLAALAWRRGRQLARERAQLA